MCEENRETDVCDICGGEYLAPDELDDGVCPMCMDSEDDF